VFDGDLQTIIDARAPGDQASAVQSLDQIQFLSSEMTLGRIDSTNQFHRLVAVAAQSGFLAPDLAHATDLLEAELLFESVFLFDSSSLPRVRWCLCLCTCEFRMSHA
jgi:hypothetical protein